MFTKTQAILSGRSCILVEGLGEYSLADTFECGQCFRYEKIEGLEGDEYLTVVGSTLINVGQRKRGELIFYGMSDEEFEQVARPYFALDTDLAAIRDDVIKRTDSSWLKDAALYSGGIAILKQDPWEALFSFIISQNNNIPRIRKIIKQICCQYGVNISLQKGLEKCPAKRISGIPCQEKCKDCGICYTFPTAEEVLEEPEKLLPSHPGFRYKYLVDAAKKVAAKEVNLDMIAAARSYTHTVECLKNITGVGDKVASCVALFGFANLEAFPIDVWMRRAIDTYFGGELAPESLGRYAGFAQQYIFHYIRNGEGRPKEDQVGD